MAMRGRRRARSARRSSVCASATGRGADGLGTVGQGTGVEGLGLRQLPGGLGTIADLARLAHHDRQDGGSQRRDPRALETACGLEDHEGRADLLSPRDEVCDAFLSVGDRPAGPGGTQGHITMGLGHINTHTALW